MRCASEYLKVKYTNDLLWNASERNENELTSKTWLVYNQGSVQLFCAIEYFCNRLFKGVQENMKNKCLIFLLWEKHRRKKKYPLFQQVIGSHLHL